ncbi:MAG: M20/M25/M40 family metallo-hydrolase, partial [Methylovirgula sp.]
MQSALELAQALIRCPSVTPKEAGALALLEGLLRALGFATHRVTFSEEGTPDVENLYARIGSGAPHFVFAGHTDVVPAGERADWRFDPFKGEVDDGMIWGRGASDMKSAIAAFVAAAAAYIEDHQPLKGSIGLLLTGDEEGPAVNGTVKL